MKRGKQRKSSDRRKGRDKDKRKAGPVRRWANVQHFRFRFRTDVDVQVRDEVHNDEQQDVGGEESGRH